MVDPLLVAMQRETKRTPTMILKEATTQTNVKTSVPRLLICILTASSTAVQC